MPMIEFAYPQGAIERESLEELVEKLTAALSEHTASLEAVVGSR